MDLAAELTYPTPIANVSFLPMLLLSLTMQKNSPDTARIINTEYDYVIVGAGSAGSVVASRLSEVSCVSVLLLEAGKPPPYITEIPGISRFLWNTDIDWAYRTAPQRYTGRLLKNRQVVWPSGKMLGGSSNLNAMLYIRGNRKDYDSWAAEGAEGWSYKDVYPYFLKLEDNRDPEYVANGFHNVGGPQTVHRPRYQPEIKDPIFQAAKEMGYRITDSNAARESGFFDHQATMRSGQRCSTAKAYLVPAENRTNLDILPRARVRKVVINNRRAEGVEFDFQGKTYVVKARREVIMSAGTVNTAQLLMLSGIGPRKELERHKIPIIADLPVGQNLQDHCGTNVNFELNPGIEPYLVKVTSPRTFAQYIQNRTGPLGSTEFVTALAFGKRDVARPKLDSPRYGLVFSEALSEIGVQIGMTPEAIAKVYLPYELRPFYLCLAFLLQPRSRGTVTLKSADPYDSPIIDPNYFEDPRDLDDIVDGLKICNRIGNSPQMRKVGSAPFKTVIPGCEKFLGNEDDYLRCHVESIIYTVSHQVGTARMGNPKDPRTVVDPQLRVKHIRGLRVIDASVMPIIPSGNTNIPTIMIAEKASDMVKSSIECYGHITDKKIWNSQEGSNWLKQNGYPDPAYDPRVLDENREYQFWKRDSSGGKWRYILPPTRNVPEKSDGMQTNLRFPSWNKDKPIVKAWNSEITQFLPDVSLLSNISNLVNIVRNIDPSILIQQKKNGNDRNLINLSVPERPLKFRQPSPQSHANVRRPELLAQTGGHVEKFSLPLQIEQYLGANSLAPESEISPRPQNLQTQAKNVETRPDVTQPQRVHSSNQPASDANIRLESPQSQTQAKETIEQSLSPKLLSSQPKSKFEVPAVRANCSELSTDTIVSSGQLNNLIGTRNPSSDIRLYLQPNVNLASLKLSNQANEHMIIPQINSSLGSKNLISQSEIPSTIPKSQTETDAKIEVVNNPIHQQLNNIRSPVQPGRHSERPEISPAQQFPTQYTETLHPNSQKNVAIHSARANLNNQIRNITSEISKILENLIGKNKQRNPINVKSLTNPPIRLDHAHQHSYQCDGEFCNSLLQFMQCQEGKSCRKMKEFSSVLYRMLCLQ